METILLTQTGGILGPFAWILGKIFEGIYFVCDKLFYRGNGSLAGLGIISLCIILFTLIVRLLMLPSTIKQQKSMKLNTVIQPEIQAIQKKYENKKDQQSQMAMSQEVSEVYSKYGASMTGGCLPLLIQMPILFALYRVIMNIPAYVGQVKNYYEVIINNLTTDQISKYFDISVDSISKLTEDNINKIVDIMSGADRTNTTFNLGELVSTVNNAAVTDAYESIRSLNQFFSFNLSDSPAQMWATLGVVALIIPILAGVTQFISVQLSSKMNSAATAATGDNPTMSSMKAMNYFMPLLSIWMCWSFASGIGLYWIAGSVVMIIQQVIINKYFKKITIDDIIAEQKEKAKKKREKKGILENQITNAANTNTKNISSYASVNNKEKEEKLAKAKEIYSNSYNKDKNSISARANMVKEFNERNK